MKAFLEIVELKSDIITTSGDVVDPGVTPDPGEPEECCEWGCDGDFDQIAGNY